MKKIPGVVQGLVTSVDDPDGLGRVKLEFPWLDDNYRTDWVPIATPMTGDQRGHFFMPEAGDEALVAFEHGDFDHPFIVGFLWNGVHKPPETEVKNRVILTPGGHTLRFEDKDGAKKVELKSKDGHRLTFDDAGREITISDGDGNNHIVISISGGQIKIQASTNVTVEAPSINLVDSSTHPVVFGDELMTYLNQIVMMYNTHTHPYFAIPSAQFQPPTPSLISTKVMTG
jgi:uncharacterized protein involved in type VI secretion and phage assembly